MSERDRRAIYEAEHGDLRPQVNPNALAGWRDLPKDLKDLEPILIDRFFQLSRPIRNARLGPHPDLRLRSAGNFFYLIETLKRLGYPRLQEVLLILLDEFSQLEERSYDELFLWAVVELSRTDLRHVRTFWPQAVLLDLRHRAAPWERPAGATPADQPYRLIDLLFYYYVLYTLQHQSTPSGQTWQPGLRKFPSLGVCLKQVAPALSEEEKQFVCRALEELARDRNRPAFSDALGLLSGGAGRRRRAEPSTEPGVQSFGP
jgi:hypothetical protein